MLSFHAEMISGYISSNYSPEHAGFENQCEKREKEREGENSTKETMSIGY